MGFRISHLIVECRSTNLALSNGVHPTGAMLSSIKVRRYTVVARSFHGLPRKHLPSVTVLALASGDCREKHWAWHLMTGSRRTYANNSRVGNRVRPSGQSWPRGGGQIWGSKRTAHREGMVGGTNIEYNEDSPAAKLVQTGREVGSGEQR